MATSSLTRARDKATGESGGAFGLDSRIRVSGENVVNKTRRHVDASCYGSGGERQSSTP